MQHTSTPLHLPSLISIPVFGHLLRLYNLKKTASKALLGDPAAARSLARNYSQCPDGTAEFLFRSLLENPISPAVTDALCREFLEHHDDLIAGMLRDYEILPSDIRDRALFLFTAGYLNDYRTLDAKQERPLLYEIYSGGAGPIREIVRYAASRYHGEADFANALVQHGRIGTAGDLSCEEWDLVTTGLIAGSRYNCLYNLLIDAPLPYTLSAIHALHVAGWKPENTSLCEYWERVVTAAPLQWAYPDRSGEKKKVLEKPGSRTRFLAFSPDGALLMAAGDDGTIRVWHVARGETILSCDCGFDTFCQLFSPDNNYLLTLSDGALTARQVSTGKILFTIPGACRENGTIAISRDSSMVAFPRAGGGVLIAAVADGHILRTADTGDGAITALAFSHDGRFIACGLEDGIVRLMSAREGLQVWASKRHSGTIEHLSFTAETFGIIVVQEKAHPFLLDENGACIRVFVAPDHKPREITISPDSRWIFITGTDDSIRIFRSDDDLPAGSIPQRLGGVASAAFFADHRRAVTGGINGIVRVFRFDSHAPEHMFTAHDGWIRKLAVSPDGTILASAGWDGMVKLWHLPEGRLLRSLDARGGAVTCLAASGDRTLLAAGTNEGLVRIWRLTGEDCPLTIDAFTGSIGAVAISSNGDLIATAGSDATVRIWELSSRSLISTLDSLKYRSYCLAFTPDNQGILAGGWDNTIRHFRVADGSLIKAYCGHTNIISSIAVIPGSETFASGSYDGTCRIWSLSESNGSLTCAGTGAGIDTVAVSPDGTIIATADRKGKIRVYSACDGSCRYAHTGILPHVTGLAIMPGNDLLIASFDDGSISYFSIRQKSHIRNLSAHAGRICGIAAAGPDHCIASAGEDGTIQLLPIPVSVSLASLPMETIPLAAQEARDHPHRKEREQWRFLSTLLELKYLHEICLCTPPPAIDEHEIMIIG